LNHREAFFQSSDFYVVAYQWLRKLSVDVALNRKEKLLNLLNAYLLINQTERLGDSLQFGNAHSQMLSTSKIYLLKSGRRCWSNPLRLSAVYLHLNLFKPNHHVVVLLLHVKKLLFKAFVLLNLLLVALVDFS